MRTPQEIRNHVLNLLKEKKLSANKMLVECGYNTSLVNDLKKGQMPSADKIAKIAQYLGITTDYLLGNEIGKENAKDPEEDLIINLRRVFYGTSSRKLSENDKKSIIELAEVLSKLKENNNQEINLKDGLG